MGAEDFGTLDVLPELRKFKKALSRRFRISKMILFGSRARGDHLRTSDVDLIIVSPDFEGIPFLRRIREVVQFWDSDLALEVLPYTPEEFTRKAQEIGIVSQAIREGLEV
jgi:predicted nucleotidyltransferase